MDPGSITPYEELVNDVYKADQNFTIEESSRLSELMSEHMTDIEDSEGLRQALL